MTYLPTPADIQRWFPERWDQIAGNTKVVKQFKKFARAGICSFVLTGRSRSCKTRMISLLIKAQCCPNTTADLNPCNNCSTCKDVMNARWEHWGLHRNLCQSKCSFLTVDCHAVKREELLDIPSKLDLESENSIVYLDEISALRERGLDNVLLKVMDESRASFFASAVSLQAPKQHGPNGPIRVISEPLLERFPLKLVTTAPSDRALKEWIQSRCADWSIDVIHPDETLDLIVKKSRNVVGRVMHFLTSAVLNDRRLDVDLVNECSLVPQN